MRTAIVEWDLPTQRTDNSALSPASIQGVEISMSADGGNNFAVAGLVTPAGVQERAFPDLIEGDYIVRLVVIDTQPQNVRSVVVDTPFTVLPSGILAAPNPVMNVRVTFA